VENKKRDAGHFLEVWTLLSMGRGFNRFHVGKQLRQMNLKSLGDDLQIEQTGIALALFNFADITLSAPSL
jgi:hypothetical protein